jgi:hypothetical protein
MLSRGYQITRGENHRGRGGSAAPVTYYDQLFRFPRLEGVWLVPTASDKEHEASTENQHREQDNINNYHPVSPSRDVARTNRAPERQACRN